MTPYLTSSPLILRLNHDILSSIFALNADIFETGHALLYTRLTSQVCRSWRNLMLSSPSLWSRLFDLDAFPPGTVDGEPGEWAKELLTRSGNAHLWVKANYEPKCGYALLLDIMCDIWHRIQVLAIVLTLDILPVIPPELFYMPAPQLEVFRVMVSKGDERDYSGIFNLWPTKPLFANDAPFLRVFNPPLSLHFDISHVDWLRNLSTMYLGPPFVVQEIISILQRTPRLETLRIERISIKPGVKSSPLPGDIRMPNLRYCFLFLDFISCAALLERMHVPPSSYLVIRPQQFHITRGSQDALQSAFKSLAAFTQRYLQSQKSKELCLSLFNSPQSFGFRHELHYSPLPTAKFDVIVWTEPHFPSHLFGFLFDQFAFQELSKVMKLKWNISIPNLTTELQTFASAFSSVKSIRISSQEALRLFCDNFGVQHLSGTSRITFPSVDIIRLCMDFMPPGVFDVLGQYGMFHRMLQSRLEQGCVVKVVDFTEGRAETLPPLYHFEEFHGMRVRWDSKEYECGSGHPERLPVRFSLSRTHFRVDYDRAEP